MAQAGAALLLERWSSGHSELSVKRIETGTGIGK